MNVSSSSELHDAAVGESLEQAAIHLGLAIRDLAEALSSLASNPSKDNLMLLNECQFKASDVSARLRTLEETMKALSQ